MPTSCGHRSSSSTHTFITTPSAKVHVSSRLHSAASCRSSTRLYGRTSTNSARKVPEMTTPMVSRRIRLEPPEVSMKRIPAVKKILRNRSIPLGGGRRAGRSRCAVLRRAACELTENRVVVAPQKGAGERQPGDALRPDRRPDEEQEREEVGAAVVAVDSHVGNQKAALAAWGVFIHKRLALPRAEERSRHGRQHYVEDQDGDVSGALRQHDSQRLGGPAAAPRRAQPAQRGVQTDGRSN
eukprot:scaffold166951_cov27-Tisochrysis_lutea.AAC.3